MEPLSCALSLHALYCRQVTQALSAMCFPHSHPMLGFTALSPQPQTSVLKPLWKHSTLWLMSFDVSTPQLQSQRHYSWPSTSPLLPSGQVPPGQGVLCVFALDPQRLGLWLQIPFWSGNYANITCDCKSYPNWSKTSCWSWMPALLLFLCYIAMSFRYFFISPPYFNYLGLILRATFQVFSSLPTMGFLKQLNKGHGPTLAFQCLIPSTPFENPSLKPIQKLLGFRFFFLKRG